MNWSEYEDMVKKQEKEKEKEKVKFNRALKRQYLKGTKPKKVRIKGVR